MFRPLQIRRKQMAALFCGLFGKRKGDLIRKNYSVNFQPFREYYGIFVTTFVLITQII